MQVKKIILMLTVLILILTGCSDETNDTIKVYMLTENNNLMETIKSFENAYPGSKIEFEIGIIDAFKTPTEAKKELNTHLLSKDGPDVIIVDDLNAEKYLECQQFEDITSIVMENQNGMMPGIKNNYSVDNKYYFFPLSISMIAYSRTLNLDYDVVTANQLIERCKNEKLNIQGMSFDNLSAIIYRTEIEPYIKENGGIDKKHLQDFYLLLNDLMQLYDGEITFASYEQINLKVNRLSQYIKLLDGETDIAVDYIDNAFDLQCLYSLKRDNLIDFSFKNSKEGYYYIPQGVIAINAESRNLKKSRELVKYLLSEDGQVAVKAEDLIPINMDVLKQSLDNEQEFEINGQIKINPWEKDDKLDFINVIEKTNSPVITDSNLMEIVMDNAMYFINGESTLSESVNSATNKLALYLKE